VRKVILSLAVSLDGYIEGPNGEYDWCFTDRDYGMGNFLKRIDAVFVGRKTYEMMLGAKGAPGFGKIKVYVFSKTLDEVANGKTLLKGDIERLVKGIKEEPGKDIWLFGGAGLTTSLMNLNLVDEISLAVHPIILGGGKPLFNNIKNRTLHLTDSKIFPNGLVSLTYRCSTERR
jgi:dihydrofolate reductase